MSYYTNRIAALKKHFQRVEELRTAEAQTESKSAFWDWVDAGARGSPPFERPPDFPVGTIHWDSTLATILCRLRGLPEPALKLVPVDRDCVELLVKNLQDEDFGCVDNNSSA